MRFCDYDWEIRNEKGNPNNNEFGKDNVKFGENIELTINDKSAEIYLKDLLGYGIYEIDAVLPCLNKNIIFSPFLYQDDLNELDIEFSRWGKIFNRNCQFVVQPNQIKRFFIFRKKVNCRINYQKEFCEFEVNGFKWKKSTPLTLQRPKFHINLWKLENINVPATKVIIRSFKHERA